MQFGHGLNLTEGEHQIIASLCIRLFDLLNMQRKHQLKHKQIIFT